VDAHRGRLSGGRETGLLVGLPGGPPSTRTEGRAGSDHVIDPRTRPAADPEAPRTSEPQTPRPGTEHAKPAWSKDWGQEVVDNLNRDVLADVPTN
jgi:hypothetical protein